MSGAEVLRIDNLSISFRVYGGYLRVVRGLDLRLNRGERVAIVGETGCGKTTTVKAVFGILPRQAVVDAGSVRFGDVDVLTATAAELADIRRHRAAMIFQDPTSSLNPIFTIGDQVEEIVGVALSHGRRSSRKHRSLFRQTAVRALSDASMPDPERILKSYPMQLSGGMRQRVCIAMALATPRELLVADEPTTNLDVTIQDQVLRLVKQLAADKGTSLILITHSLGVARETAERIHVMYAGTMVEMGHTAELFESPLHPYTRLLLSSVPKLTGDGISQGIPGRLPDYLHPPVGCRFAPRCPSVMPVCEIQAPKTVEVAEHHHVACFSYGGMEASNE